MSGFHRRIGMLIGVATWSLASPSALACPICFQMDQGPVTQGVIGAVVVLLSITVGVLACFARFAIRLARSERT